MAPVVVLVPPSCCGAGYFRRVRRELAGRVECRAVELPGHGRRFAEPRLTSATDAVRDVAGQVTGPVDAVYGESLGAYVGLALVGVLDQGRPPLLFAAANSPPSTRDPIRTDGLDTAEAAVAALTAMGGKVPAEVLADPELAGQAYPLIRDDLYLSSSFVEATGKLRVTADIEAVAGTADPTLHHLAGWAAHTSGRCAVTRVPGGHLLSATNPAAVAQLIHRTLTTATRRTR